MVSAITSWFLSQGLSAILGFAAKMIMEYFAQQRHEDEIRERAKLEEQHRQLEDSVRIQAKLAEEAAKRVSDEDALKRLEEGSA